MAGDAIAGAARPGRHHCGNSAEARRQGIGQHWSANFRTRSLRPGAHPADAVIAAERRTDRGAAKNHRIHRCAAGESGKAGKWESGRTGMRRVVLTCLLAHRPTCRLPAPRRHGQREDGNLFAGDCLRAATGQRRHRARAGNFADAPDRRAVQGALLFRAVADARRGVAQPFVRGRTPR